jgi:hypothetical protein
MDEVWKDCICYENSYEISNYGRVRSKDRYVPCNTGIKFVPSVLLKPSAGNGGYLATTLYGWGLKIGYYTHRLVWETFQGGIPCDMEINHIDGDKKNNFIGNLEVVTPSENQIHAHKIGLAKGQTGHRGSGIDEGDIIRIFALSKKGITNKEISEIYKVSPSYISQIITGSAWQHLIRPSQYEYKRKNRMPLDQSVVMQIKRKLKNGQSIKEISLECNVPITTISKIKQGKRHSSVKID